jgi:hypothetical protein
MVVVDEYIGKFRECISITTLSRARYLITGINKNTEWFYVLGIILILV